MDTLTFFLDRRNLVPRVHSAHSYPLYNFTSIIEIQKHHIQAFLIVFQQDRGWSPGIGGLAFIPIGIGMMIAIGLVFYFNNLYVKRANKEGGIAPPEARLPMAMLGGVLLPIGVSPTTVIRQIKQITDKSFKSCFGLRE